MSLGLRCPHCKGYVKTLVRGLGEEYAGRHRLCMKCGTMWHLGKVAHRLLLTAAVVVTIAVAILPYAVVETSRADIWFVCWLPVALGIVWPLGYFVVWKWKLRR